MDTLLISLLTLVLLLISAFVVLIVLMQRTSQSGGMGAALGGGAAESAFGSETNNILTKGTVYGIIAFFLVALGLYLLYQAQAADAQGNIDMNTLISAEQDSAAAEAPAPSEAAGENLGTSLPKAESVTGEAAGSAVPAEDSAGSSGPESSPSLPVAE
jgi:preprotein translocase subunit SecG